MSNSDVQTLVTECDDEFVRIEGLIYALTSTNPAVPFLTKYAVIKACGTLEQAFKVLISDFSCIGQSSKVKNFVDISFRESSINPNLDNIHKSLKKFHEPWNVSFKNFLDTDADIVRIKSSITSLNNARNQFAHGGNPTVTFNDVKNYFEDAKKIIDYIDQSLI
ncbi:HEPN domain-containing protein [Algoriphagus aquimarinus]|uniref:HEPN domain-containing protein n=1 Tax=Algoriphagus aquimarinus TaxID=237018 RepID=UPI0030D972C4|tara:strand:- start:8026 stop:8517 length:492 start_codon:yes stop_codon:yes gene_type:complete